MKKITALLREYVVGLSIIIMICGFVLLIIGVLWYWFRDALENDSLQFIHDLGDWNAYLLVGGLIIFGIGLYYIYSYITKRKFVLEEIKTNKRSEFLKKHKELKGTVKHLPSKYQKMVKDKEKELKIK
ncbi:MAG: hypothetical protein V3V27_02105 [Candidatus Thermoplasmatota archaeon]